MKSILFVCSANQCRSPMAQVLFQELVRERGEDSEWRVESAGIWAYGGAPATENARLAMEKRGLDLSSHRSKPATSELLSQFDLIVVMTREQRDVLLAQMPFMEGKVFLLRGLGGESGDFADPVGGDIRIYEIAADRIFSLLERSFLEIVEKLYRGD
jgi:protein-tyrosine-phosphatase